MTPTQNARRRLIKGLSLAPLAGVSSQLLAAPDAPARLLVVFLRGGYDAASLLVPVTSSFYYASRPAIAIAPVADDPLSALRVDADWGLHPALKDSVYPLFERRQLAFIPFAGTHDTSRSHFETQDSIELAQDGVAARDLASGFLNRLAQVLDAPGDAISFTDQLPLVMRGSQTIGNMALRNPSNGAISGHESNLIAAMYRGNALSGRVSDGFRVRQEVAQEMASEMSKGTSKQAAQNMAGEMLASARNAVYAKGFELEARRVARLMRDRYKLGFIDVGGWDTHVGQGAGSGYLANRFDELGRGLAAFANEAGAAWQNTVVVVISEFGRTFRENGNRGTDHGHGTVFWVLGGAVRGGRVIGEQCKVEQATLFQDRDYPVLNEYRAVLGGLMSRLYGLNAAQLDAVFPGAPISDLGIV